MAICIVQFATLKMYKSISNKRLWCNMSAGYTKWLLNNVCVSLSTNLKCFWQATNLSPTVSEMLLASYLSPTVKIIFQMDKFLMTTKGVKCLVVIVINHVS